MVDVLGMLLLFILLLSVARADDRCTTDARPMSRGANVLILFIILVLRRYEPINDNTHTFFAT